MNKRNIFIGFLVLMSLFLTACDDFFSADADDILLGDDNFQKRSELYASFIGNAALFQDAAEQALYISELRGDLMEPTENAPVDFWNVYRYQSDENNSLTQANVFYKVILGCNDFLRHAITFNKNNPGVVENNIYQGMISETLRFRAWAYLTLGKIYGEVAWHDLSLQDFTEDPKVEVVKFKDLPGLLLSHLANGVEGIDGTVILDWNLITYTEDKGWNRIGVHPNALMGELYLWKQEYKQAVDQFLNLIRNSGDDKTFTIVQFTNNQMSKWREIFCKTITAAEAEIITGAPYDYTRQQVNKLQYYFSAVSPNVYYLRPTDRMISLFGQQSTTTGKKGDNRGSSYTYSISGGKKYIVKYSYDKDPEEQDATIPVYRASDIHLMIAECLNRLHLFTESLAFVNGLKSYWNSGGYFNKPFNNPMFPANLKDCAGVRGRMSMKSVTPELDDMTDEEKEVAIDSIIVEEVALECAYEGKRYFALMRSALRWEQPEIMAETLSAKFPDAEERETYKNLLMNPDNWFLKQKPVNEER